MAIATWHPTPIDAFDKYFFRGPVKSTLTSHDRSLWNDRTTQRATQLHQGKSSLLLLLLRLSTSWSFSIVISVLVCLSLFVVAVGPCQ